VPLVFKNKLTLYIEEYCVKWLLKINLKRTKKLIFRKQNRKSTREKFSFFLNGNQIAKASVFSYLGVTLNSDGSFSNSKKKTVEKTSSLRSWQNCICARSFGGEGARKFQSVSSISILRAASSPLPSQNFASANDPAGYAG